MFLKLHKKNLHLGAYTQSTWAEWVCERQYFCLLCQSVDLLLLLLLLQSPPTSPRYRQRFNLDPESIRVGSLTVPAVGVSLPQPTTHTHTHTHIHTLAAVHTHTHTHARLHRQTYGVLLLPPALDLQPAVRWVKGIYVRVFLFKCIRVCVCVCTVYILKCMCYVGVWIWPWLFKHVAVQYNNGTLIVSYTFQQTQETLTLLLLKVWHK